MQVESLVGREIDGFVIEERIGRGGMSVVYRAFQPSMHRYVALKVIRLNPDLDEQDEFRQRFALEASLVAALEHIHILPLYQYGIVDNDVAYIAMRLLKGGSLSNLLTEGPLTLERTSDILSQVARALSYAHAKGIVHRDVKPSNILFDELGNAFVTDFGLAKPIDESRHITKTGNIVGTPTYMSPEQLRGEPTDNRSDIYSLGVMLFHMLAGRPPFEASDTNIISIIYQHLEKLPPPLGEFNPNVTPRIEAIVDRALMKAPGDRPASADEVADTLSAALVKQGSTSTLPVVRLWSRPTLPRLRLRRGKRKSRGVIVAAVAALVMAVLLVGFFYLQSRDIVHPAVVMAGEQGTWLDAAPSGDEVAAAQRRVGAQGFIGFLACNQTSEYWATLAREMRDVADQYGLAFRVYDSDNDKTRQIPLIERARADGVSLLIICALDPELIAPSLRSAQDDELPLVLIHADMPSYGGVIVTGDERLMGLSAGRLAGQLIRDEHNGQARVVILDYPELPSLVARADAIEAGILELAPNANIVGRYRGGTSEAGQQSIQTLLDQGVEFDVIASINDAGAFGAIDALDAAGVAPDSVAITSIDGEALAQEYISQGHFMRGSVNVQRERFSQTAIDAAVRLLAGGTLPEEFTISPGDMITRDSLNQ